MTPARRMFPLHALSATVVRADRQPVASPVDDALDEAAVLERRPDDRDATPNPQFCRHPATCAGRKACPRDPACND